mgnify:CR=1 FL=1
MTKFLCLVGLSYGKKNCSPGDVCTDIPAQSIEWLLEQGAIKPVEKEAGE